jgi:hypothetical protein
MALLCVFAVAAKRGARFREVIPISVSSVFEILQDVQPMALTHGHSITAEEIERLVSREFTPVKYAALCNAVSWALSGRKCDSLPSFTERVNVKRKCVLKFARYRSCGEAYIELNRRLLFRIGEQSTYESVRALMAGQPSNLRVRFKSSLKISRARATPAWPAAARPYAYARPQRTARAPKQIALTISAPRRIPPSISTSI